jgi:hypothetical protein
MARHKLSAAETLRGLKKALANPKTPKQFLKSLRTRIKRLS